MNAAANWFPIILVQLAFVLTVWAVMRPRSRALPRCPRGECSDKTQCWEQCGDLGHSERHARPSFLKSKAHQLVFVGYYGEESGTIHAENDGHMEKLYRLVELRK